MSAERGGRSWRPAGESEHGDLFAHPGGEEGAGSPLTLALTGAKGGVGATFLSANLAVYFATIGRRTLLVDADARGAAAHGFLGVAPTRGIDPYQPPRPAFAPAEGARRAAPPEPAPVALAAEARRPVPAGVPGLWLWHAGLDERPRAERRARGTRALRAMLQRLHADVVLLDLGQGLERSLLRSWLGGALRLFVTLPEPTSVEGTYRFARHAFARELLDGQPDPLVRRRLRVALRELGHAPAPLDLRRYLAGAGDVGLARHVEAAMDAFDLPFVVNQSRVRADLDLGSHMVSAARRRLGLRLRYLGHVDYDDTVHHCLRNGRPLLVESPGTKASRNVERIARRVLSPRRSGRQPGWVPPASHHDVLEVDRGATDEEVRRATKRAREIYADGSLSCRGLLDAEGLAALRARVEEAHDVLLDPARRRPYELSVFPPEPEPHEEVADREDAPPPPPAPAITPDTEFTGALLREVRASQGVSLDAISKVTKIGVSYLEALESDDFPRLPAIVYVRGFVTELAKFLKLDPEHVSRSYVRRLARHLEN